MQGLWLTRLRGWRFGLLILMLGCGHMVVLFNAAAYVTLLPHAAGNLGGVLPSFGTWAQTDFMIALALGFPLARWLAARFGEYRVFVWAFVIYAAASGLCAAGDSLWSFLPGRVLLGLAGGVTLPLGQALMLNEHPDRLKSLGLGIWGIFTLMPFTVGLPVGGWIADELGWRALFALNIPLALIIAGVTGALLYGRGFERRKPALDLVGIGLLVLVLGAMQTLLNQGNDFDWLDSPFLQGVLVTFIIALPCLVVWELAEPQPAIDVRLLTVRNVAVGVICLTLGFLAIQGLLALFVVQLQLLMGYSSYLAGMVFMPMLLLGVPVIAVMHVLCKYIDVRVLASLTFLGFAATYFWIGLFDDPQSYDQIFWPMVLEGVFLGAFFTPLTVLTLHGLAGEQMKRAAEMVTLLRIAAGAFGITLQGVVMFRRLPFHQLHLADHFGGRVSVSFDALDNLIGRFERMGVEANVMKARLAALIKQQAGILALNDAFLLASYLCIGLAVVVWVATSTRVPLSPPDDALAEWQAEELAEEA